MRILHLVRSECDETAKILMQEVSTNVENNILPLFQGNVDYDQLLEEIFSSEKVISWW